MRRTATLVVVLAALLVPAVAPVATRAQAPRPLVVQAATEPPGLDLTATPASATAAVLFYNVQEALVKVDRHGKLVPWLAERWHTTDNRNYTFFLKRGVRFHNGREIDRKSTRLNSSHGYISYAVFCLKKKKSKILD